MPSVGRINVIWEGDDGQEEALTGSLCKDLVPLLNVGEWSRLDDVRKAMPERAPDGGERTGLRLSSHIATSKIEALVQVPTMTATYQMLAAAIEAVQLQEGSTKELWIRVE